MNKSKQRYQSKYRSQVKRNSQNRKKKLVRNLFLLFAVFIVVGIVFSKRTYSGFRTVLTIEAALAIGAIALAYYLKKHGSKVNKANTKNRSNPGLPIQKIKRYTEERYITEHKVKSNFDWILDKKSETAAVKEVAVEEPVNIIKQIKEERKFMPYRSPFEPINPVNKTKEEVVKAAENEKVDAEIDNQQNEEDYNSENVDTGDSTEVSMCESQEQDIFKTGINITFDDGSKEVSDETPYDMSNDDGLDEEAIKGNEHIVGCIDEDNENEVEEELNTYVDYGDISSVEDEQHEIKEDSEEPVSEEIDTNNEKPRVVRLIKKVKGTVVFQGAGREAAMPVQKRKIEAVLPSTVLLKKKEEETEKEQFIPEEDYNAKKLIETLASFGVGAKVVNISKGPTVTRYELQPNIGVKVSKIVNLADDIALNLAATAVRIEAPIPGKAAIGIEIPNKEITSVLLRDVIESHEFAKHPSKLAFAVGKDISGNTVVADIAKMPHLLIAGATGSGKSVCINTLIASILYKASPSEVRLLMVDPKVVELNIYNGIPHLLIPVVTDPKKAAGALNWAIQEMATRYKLFADNSVRDLKGYNSLIRHKGEGEELPQIVIIIDELADLMMAAPNDVEDSICRLAQMARAAGMHLVIATQRPSVDVITGIIKANIPSRISFAVTSQVDSRTILDMSGAEKLLGRGDMLFSPVGAPKPIRVQGAFISDKEVEAIVDHLKSTSTAQYDEEILQKIEKTAEPAPVESDGDDELLQPAIELVIDCGQASSSLIQRKFKVGYARAARIVDQMEAWGVVSASDGSKPRKILVTRQEWEDLNA
jgi:DNA segregation ATPase FtsK/SpoIIIE, S-DNA-T family